MLRPCCSLLTHYRRRGPCRDGDPYQEFYVEHQDEESEGRIRYALHSPLIVASSHPPRRDGETGRCLSIPNCQAIKNSYYPVSLEVCGKGDCGGKNSLWTTKPAPAGSEPGQEVRLFSSTQDPTTCLNVPDDKSAVDDFELIAWKPCASVGNFAFRFDVKKRRVRSPPGGYPQNVGWINTACPGGAEDCCLIAEPCTAPCSLPVRPDPVPSLADPHCGGPERVRC